MRYAITNKKRWIQQSTVLTLGLFALQILLFSKTVLANEHCEKGEVSEEHYQRIVSIGGANTEIIYALGKGHLIVATDTTSYYPIEAKETPKVGYQRALSVEGILSTRPDLIIASDQAGPSKVIKQLKSTGIEYLMVNSATDTNQVSENISLIGSVLCAEKASYRLTSQLHSAMSALPSVKAERKRKVLFVLQHGGGAPLVAGIDTSAANIIKLSGGINAIDQFEGYKPLTPEALISADPDVILTTDVGLEQAGGLEKILSLPGISITTAGKNRTIVSMDSLLLLGFGPRTIDAANLLHQKLYSRL